jgi:N-acetylmuramoyl-L-alanine amidase
MGLLSSDPTRPPLPGLPLARGATGDAVRDLQQRLIRCDVTLVADPPGRFGSGTLEAVRTFQERQGLRVDGICGPQTWSALIEASYHLGDRLLYQRTPMLRGDDVAELQLRLSSLGFHEGRVDGIFGPQTAAALTEFQRNAGLTTDGVFGPDALAVLERIGGRTGTTTKAGVQERIDLRSGPRNVAGRRVVVAESGAMPALANALGRALDDAGAVSLVVHHPDGSAQAAEANRFDAEVFIGLGLRDAAGSRLAYYATTGFESAGGRRLAELAQRELADLGAPPTSEVAPMRLPVLRETRMPALLCEVGPAPWLVEHNADVAASLARAVVEWSDEPIVDDPV